MPDQRFRGQTLGVHYQCGAGFSLRGFSLRGFSLRGFSLRGFSLREFSLRDFTAGAEISLLGFHSHDSHIQCATCVLSIYCVVKTVKMSPVLLRVNKGEIANRRIIIISTIYCLFQHIFSPRVRLTPVMVSHYDDQVS